jgi:phospholipid/cholesterol/gamma-HCH transport system substrate-binding protein
VKRSTIVRSGLAIALTLTVTGGAVIVTRSIAAMSRTHIVGYFANSNGIYPGDDVMILGVPVGRVDSIEPQPGRAKISFWFDDSFKVPADAKAVILSPQLITSRAIELTPVYTGGPQMHAGAVIPQDHTAVPVEWDDFRQQLEKLTQTLQPTEPGGVSPLGAFINTAADNLRGQGADIRNSIIQLSQAISALSDHSTDIFSTIRNLSTLVSALQSSSDVMGQLNVNLASATALLSNQGNELGRAIADVESVSGAVHDFAADNREALGVTSDKLSSISQTVVNNIDQIKQALHVAPNAFQNYINIYEPAHAAQTGVLALNNFANPITFLCSAIQAASRLGAEQSAKLCVQYLAPIIKNRQFNFPPIGQNFIVNAQARPNEVTYSEDWMRPDYRPAPPQPRPDAPLPSEAGAPPAGPASTTIATNPADGLSGIMVPGRSGS